jgi:hypothetical protein
MSSATLSRAASFSAVAAAAASVFSRRAFAAASRA